jgi:hypothetical protein
LFTQKQLAHPIVMAVPQEKSLGLEGLNMLSMPE